LDVASLPFDQFQRYRLAADLLEEVRDRQTLQILDVGGRTALLRAFLPFDDVALVDVEPSEERPLVLGDGAALPFRENAFDAVCAFDTLEHVPPAARADFVRECARVARRWVVLAGPYASPRVDEAEELLVEFLREKLGVEHRYLSEHRAHGLPERVAVVAGLESLGARVASYGQGNLERWLALMCMEMYMDHDPLLRPIAARFFRFYNEALHASDHAPPVYRHAVVAAFDGAELPAGRVLETPTVAPRGAFTTVSSLARELFAFDGRRDVWQPEQERLEKIIGDLERDLEGHRRRLEEERADLAAHEQTLTELRSTYETTLEEHEQERGLLKSDLIEHAKALAEARQAHSDALAETLATREELDRERGALNARELELAEHRRVQADLEAHLARTEEGAQAIQADLVASQGKLAAEVARAGELEAEIAALRAALRDRWGNLKRAFGKKAQF